MLSSSALSRGLWVIVCATLIVVAPHCIGRLHAADPVSVSVQHERYSNDNIDKSIVQIPVNDGLVAASDLLTGLGRVAGLDLGAIEWLLPDGELDLQKPQTEKRVARINRVLGRYSQVRITHDHDSAASMVIEIDHARLHTDKRRARNKFRQVSLRILDPRGRYRSQNQFGLAMDEPAMNRTGDHLIVGVHGFSGRGRAMDTFLDPLRDGGFACASFAYPNDQPIADSARLLADELKALARHQPDRRVVLVTFSMGGLVARAAIEDPKLDPGNVERLVMIAPPNHGSVCARFARGFDLYEHIGRERKFGPRGMLAASMLDGLGEARHDLCPDSHFLRQLNGRERNANVRYSILLGEGGELNQDQVDRIVASIDKLEQKSTLARVFGPRLDRMRQEFSELSQPGDGFVSVKRGRLDGVDDIETFRFSHIGRFDDREDDGVLSLHKAIARRMK